MWNKRGKILVTYVTKWGSTCEVAETIGKILREKGFDVDVFPVKGVVDVTHYSAVVIGSGIRVGKLYSEVVHFVKKNKEQLKKIPVAYFIDSFKAAMPDAKSQAEAEGYLGPLRKLVAPVDAGIFAGKVDPRKIPISSRLVLKVQKIKEGDYRRWSAIERWAAELPKKLRK